MRPYGKPVHAQGLAVPDPGPERVAGHREAQRRPARAGQVLPHGRDEHRRPDGADAPPRHGRRARASRSGGRTRPTTRCRTRSSRRARSSGSSRSARARTRRTRSSRAGSRRRSRRSTPARSCARTASGCPPTSYEAVNALAGSFVSDDIEDYYLNPWELGYGPFVKFDHDFIGREALEQVDREAQRRKVTLAWNSEDLAEIFASVFDPEGDALPVLRPAERELRLVELRLRDRRGGRRRRPLAVHRATARTSAAALSLATVDPEIEVGTELRVVWGEPDGGTRKTTVQPHGQKEVRVIVSPVPYSEVVRESYADGWRTKGAVT